MPRWSRAVVVFALLLVPQFSDTARAQPAPPPQPHAAGAQPSILLTVFLKHDQSKTLNEINEQLFRNGYYDKFPPDGIEVVSWYVVMGIGQIVTLRLPGRTPARGERRPRADGMGRVPHGILPHLRLQAGGGAAAPVDARSQALTLPRPGGRALP